MLTVFVHGHIFTFADRLFNKEVGWQNALLLPESVKIGFLQQTEDYDH